MPSVFLEGCHTYRYVVTVADLHQGVLKMKYPIAILTLVLALLSPLLHAASFTYQGQLSDNNSLPSSNYDFEFLLFDAVTGGSQIGTTQTAGDVQVIDGIFSVELDFGNSFDGNDYWLEVHVRAGTSTGGYTQLLPRQYLSFAPNAQYAIAASDGPFWNLAGNSGAGNFLGTTDSSALELRVNNQRVGLIKHASDFFSGSHAPNILLGSKSNQILSPAYGATISGGGGDSTSNTCGNNGTQPCINTVAGVFATVSGGWANYAAGDYATVGGGSVNTASGIFTMIGGGSSNTASGTYATVGGGKLNTASAAYATVGGGKLNTASAAYATIGGGKDNAASISSATVGGGQSNTASDVYATVPGGYSNQAGGYASFAAGFKAIVRDATTVGDTNGDEGTFIWADSTNTNFTSTGPNQFLVRASGGVIFTDNSTQNNPNNSQVLIDSASMTYPLRVRVNGTTALAVNNQRKVGVGTISPENAFHVQANTTGGSVGTHVAQIENTNTGTDADGLAIVLGTTSNPGTTDNYISFYKSGGGTALIGQIEGNGSGGVSYNTTGADFAEYLPTEETNLQAGEVVGLHQGCLSRDTQHAERVLVISGTAAFVGAAPPEDKTRGYALAAFMGQVPVKVRGAARPGDWLVASGNNDGFAEARSLAELQPQETAHLIGRALEAGENGQVKALVGLSPQALLAAQQEENQSLKARLVQLENTQQTLLADREVQQQQLARLQQALQTLQAKQQQLLSLMQASPTEEEMAEAAAE